MRVYKDIFTNDAMFTENHKFKLVSEVLFEVTGRIGPRANGSEVEAVEESEEDDENTVSASRCGVDVITENHLVETFFEDKEQLAEYLTGLLQKLVTKLTDPQIESFQSIIQNLLSRFDGLQFFTGESMDRDGTIALLEYRDIDGFRTPIVMFFKHGLVKEQIS